MEKYLYKQECYNIIGAAMEVHSELGHGFLEPVYQEALTIILEERSIPFVKEQVLDIHFKSKVLKKKYVADFICYNEIIQARHPLICVHLCYHLSAFVDKKRPTNK